MSGSSSTDPHPCTSVGGGISENSTWTVQGSPYCVSNSIEVNSGIILTIQPGVVIKFSPGAALQIDGTLIAQGTPANAIAFTSINPSPQPGDWGNIYFSPSSVAASLNSNGNYAGGSVIQYATIQYAGGAQVLGSPGQAAVQMVTSAAYLDNDVIQKNKADGIGIDYVAKARITNNQLLTNGEIASSGILVYQNAAAQDIVIEGNVITGTKGDGIALNTYLTSGLSATGTISKNTITANQGNGVFTSACGLTELMTNNTITGNLGSGVSVYDNCTLYPITMRGNTISGNAMSGINIDDSGESAMTIEGNLISDNTGPFGAGIEWNHGYGSISGNTVNGNSGSCCGGGIYIFQTYAGLDITRTQSAITKRSKVEASISWEFGPGLQRQRRHQQRRNQAQRRRRNSYLQLCANNQRK